MTYSTPYQQIKELLQIKRPFQLELPSDLLRRAAMEECRFYACTPNDILQNWREESEKRMAREDGTLTIGAWQGAGNWEKQFPQTVRYLKAVGLEEAFIDRLIISHFEDSFTPLSVSHNDNREKDGEARSRFIVGLLKERLLPGEKSARLSADRLQCAVVEAIHEVTGESKQRV